ncbi:MAG: hypothetical protein EON57_13970 [Alphaproteobacteria bacterium]|nr:MAG: hypothetical protein EON57_13970 [Alphaproteobacteria bacterium]
MIRFVVIALTCATAAGCAPQPYESLPTSPVQWERRQERIQREETERLNRCNAMNKESERYARECQRPGGATQ